MDSVGHAEEAEQAQATAASGPVAAPQGLTADPLGTILFLQRHAGNRAVARMVRERARRILARDPTDNLAKDPGLQDLMPDPRRSDLGGTGDPVQLDDTTTDRYDKIAGSGGTEVLKKINPSAMNFTKYPCTKNCPKAASDAQNYLNTGSFPSSTCDPLAEASTKGYSIDPGPDSWNKAKDWRTAFAAIKKALPSHGSCVIVEGDRGSSTPAGLTQWHYFVVANVRGNYVFVDAFIGQVSTDGDAYIRMLQTVSYSWTAQSPTVKAVR